MQLTEGQLLELRVTILNKIEELLGKRTRDTPFVLLVQDGAVTDIVTNVTDPAQREKLGRWVHDSGLHIMSGAEPDRLARPS